MHTLELRSWVLLINKGAECSELSLHFGQFGVDQFLKLENIDNVYFGYASNLSSLPQPLNI